MTLAIGIGVGITFPSKQGGGGATYEPEAVALFARMTVQPDSTRKGLINDLIKSLKTAGSWAKFDAFYVTAAHDAQAARQNWIADLYNLVPVASPTFTADRGYQGDGASSYLSSGFNAQTSPSPKFVQDNSHLGAWIRTSSGSGGAGVVATSRLSFITSGSTLYARGNAAADQAIAGVSAGHLAWSRDNSANYKAYIAGTPQTVTAASVAPTNGVFTLGALAGPIQFSTQQFASFHWGSALSDAEMSATKTALQTYMQAIGAA